MTSKREQDMRRTGMINRIGCLAIALVVILAIVLGASVTYGGLQKKHGKAMKELETLKGILSSRLDTPGPLGTYVREKQDFDVAMGKIRDMKAEVDSAVSLPELDARFDDFKKLSMEIRDMVDPAVANDQAVRNQFQNIDGTYNRYIVQREIVVDAITAYNSAFSGFPESTIGGFFGLSEMPLDSHGDNNEE